MRQRKRYTQVLIDLENGLVQPIGLSEYLRDDGQRDNFRGLMPNELPNLVGDRAIVVAAQSFVNEHVAPRLALAEGDAIDNGVESFDRAAEVAARVAEQVARANAAQQERNAKLAALLGEADRVEVPVVDVPADADLAAEPPAVEPDSPQDL